LEVSFRELARADACELGEFCFLDSPLEERVGRVIDELEEMAQGQGVTLVVLCAGRVVGMGKVAFAGEHAWMHNMNVREEVRGQGVGAELTRRLACAARGAGAKRMFAHVRADNAAARRAYEKAGMRCWCVDGMRGEQLRYGLVLG